MSRFPIPDISVRTVYEITPRLLEQHNISFLLIDLDNTLAPYGLQKPSNKLKDWIMTLKEAGIEPYILSNNRGKRPSQYAEILDIGYIRGARKPRPEKLIELLELKGISKENAALAGDQVYADVLCARRAGIKSILVRPVSIKNPFIALRYGLETPFRSAGRNRNRIVEVENYE
jgi:HAD superfamily phosphatase (TIGR01668 family)